MERRPHALCRLRNRPRDRNSGTPTHRASTGAGGGYRKLLVTVGETEDGEPDIEAIGFANADHDPAKELIVILAWNEPHYGACGPVYEVRIFDDPKLGEASLRRLPISKHFGGGCEHFRFKTVAAVKRELTRLGY